VFGHRALPLCAQFQRVRNLSPPLALLGLQVSFANGFAAVLEHGGPTPRNAQCFIDIPDKDF
jgi:hypothetical protein